VEWVLGGGITAGGPSGSLATSGVEPAMVSGSGTGFEPGTSRM
jgi:hypothetical protein